jgi:hypothetical protein
MKKHIIIISLIFCSVAKLSAQVYYYPIAGKQSHPELEIVQIEITENTTLINLQVTNKRDQGGWFCADKNIYIKNSKETEIYPLINSVNIPAIMPAFHFLESSSTIITMKKFAYSKKHLICIKTKA